MCPETLGEWSAGGHMADEQYTAAIAQLQTQQALFTQSLKAMLEGRWQAGANTVEGYLYALDPQMTGTLELDVPITESEFVGGEPPKA
jgi:hypothetical protein